MEKETQTTESQSGAALMPPSLSLAPCMAVRGEALASLLCRLPSAEWVASWRGEDHAQEKPYEVQNGVAVIPLVGILSRDVTWWSYWYNGTALTAARKMYLQAEADEEVSAILFYIFSPGGDVYGVSDLAGSVRQGKKTTWAYIADEGCSAAYWIASQCKEIVTSSRALIGSIGVMNTFEDMSRAFQKAGISIEIFESGPLKSTATPGTKLTEEQRAYIQSLVDALAAGFFADVQEGRNLSEPELEAVTDGRVWIAQDALDLKLVDRLDTLEATIERLQGSGTNRKDSLRRLYGANHSPANSGKEKTNMLKEFLSKLAARFSQRGKMQMAATVIGADENNLEKLVDDLCAQVDTEVQSQVAAHPMLTALTAAGVTTPEAVSTLVREAGEGRAYGAEVTTQLMEAAVRRFGQEKAEAMAAAYRHLPVAERKATADTWNADADKQFGTTATTAAKRMTVPTALKTEAQEVSDRQSPLTDEQRSRIKKTAEAAAKNGGVR